MAILKKIGIILGFSSITLSAMAQRVNDQIFRGNEKYISKEYTEAMKFYNDALNKESDNAVALYNLGAAHFKNGNLESAKTAFQQTIAHADNKSLQQKAWYNLGVANVQEKNYEEGIKAFKEAVKLDPKDEEARYNLQKALQLKQQPPPPQQQQNKKDQNKNQNNNKNNQSKLDKEAIEQYLKSLEEREQNIRQRINERSKQNSNKPEKDW